MFEHPRPRGHAATPRRRRDHLPRARRPAVHDERHRCRDRPERRPRRRSARRRDHRRRARQAGLDADTLDGKDSTAFLGRTEQAADADTLDGRQGTDYLPFYAVVAGDGTLVQGAGVEEVARQAAGFYFVRFAASLAGRPLSATVINDGAGDAQINFRSCVETLPLGLDSGAAALRSPDRSVFVNTENRPGPIGDEPFMLSVGPVALGQPPRAAQPRRRRRRGRPRGAPSRRSRPSRRRACYTCSDRGSRDAHVTRQGVPVLSERDMDRLRQTLYPRALEAAGEADSARNREIAANDYWLFLQAGGGGDAEAVAALARGLRSCDAR